MTWLPDIPPEEQQVFLQEAEDLLQVLEEGLVHLEHDDGDQATIQAVFRAAHTLKGSAGAIGFVPLADLTHAMETVLDDVRHARRRMDRALADTLFDALDELRRLLDDGAATDRFTSVLDRLRQAVEPQTAVASSSAEDRRAPGSVWPSSEDDQRSAMPGATTERVWRVVVRPAPGPWSGVRAVQALLTLESLGAVVGIDPDRGTLERGEPIDAVTVSLATRAEPPAIALALEGVPDLDEVNITPDGPVPAKDPASTHSDGANAVDESLAARQATDGVMTGLANERADPVDAGARSSSGGGHERSGATRTVRIDISRLDALMTLVGELVVARNRLLELTNRMDDDLRATVLAEDLDEAAQHLGRVTDQLQEEVMKSRLLPIRLIFQRLPRLVRDLAGQLGKEVTLQVAGEETELDRTVIEEVADPVIHIIRNAIDHGIEAPDERVRAGKPRAGELRVTAAQQEGWVVVTIEDDGRGIDVERVRERAVQAGFLTPEQVARLDDHEAVQLIFLPGLSTAAAVSDISGRGVGMDVVRANTERLNGSVSVETWPGRGTRFTLRFPLTLAITRALLVAVGTTVYAIPLNSVSEAFRIATAEIQSLVRAEAVLLRGTMLPLVRLRQLFGEDVSERDGQTLVVAVRAGSQQLGLVVDRLLGTQELVVKPLPTLVRRLPALVGSATLGDGRIALILDPGQLNTRAGMAGERYDRSAIAVS